MSSSNTPRKFVRLRSRPTAADKNRLMWREITEWLASSVLFLAASSSILITVAIVAVLVLESRPFFEKTSLIEFLTSTEWSPETEEDEDNAAEDEEMTAEERAEKAAAIAARPKPKYGILPFVSATITTTVIALIVAIPIGTVVALYLSEFAPFYLREILKPSLELLSAVPTVVYGYFAIQVVSPVIGWLFQLVSSQNLSQQNMLSAGIVMGIMIIPYVSSLSEDALRSVPMLLREGSYALGANKILTAWRVVVPSATSGVAAAYILGISRAIGETMIMAVAAGKNPKFTVNPLETAQTITSFIVETATGEPPAGSVRFQAMFAAGCVLFCMTLVFNVLGYWLRRRFHQSY